MVPARNWALMLVVRDLLSLGGVLPRHRSPCSSRRPEPDLSSQIAGTLMGCRGLVLRAPGSPVASSGASLREARRPSLGALPHRSALAHHLDDGGDPRASPCRGLWRALGRGRRAVSTRWSREQILVDVEAPSGATIETSDQPWSSRARTALEGHHGPQASRRECGLDEAVSIECSGDARRRRRRSVSNRSRITIDLEDRERSQPAKKLVRHDGRRCATAVGFDRGCRDQGRHAARGTTRPGRR